LKNQWKDKAIRIVFTALASTSILVVVLIFLFLGKEAFGFFHEPGLKELLNTRWIPVSFKRETFGIIPLITGSALVTFLATAIAVPISILSAIYISEFAGDREKEILKPLIELLAGIPSVVLGFFGLVVLAPIVKQVFGLSTGLIALTGAILLAFMAVPTIVSIAEDAIRSTPMSFRNASSALGASRLQTTWNVIVPAALPGIIAAVMLGMGRVIGETMAVMMVTGNAAIITGSPLESVRTLTATIAAEMGEVPFGSTHYMALFCVGIVLLITTFIINVIAQKVLERHRDVT